MLLHKHNSETYANMVSLFASNQRVAAVQPTGTGKSYLIMQLIADNPDKLFAVCSPSTYIFGQMREIADANATIEGIEYIEDRHLDKGKMLRFATCNYVAEGRHIILMGASHILLHTIPHGFEFGNSGV